MEKKKNRLNCIDKIKRKSLECMDEILKTDGSLSQ